MRVEWPDLEEFFLTLMYAVKRGWELYENWVTWVVWELCSILTRVVKRGWELNESWETRVEWEFCSTLVRVVKQGWELYESRVTRFRRRVLFNFNARGHTRISVHEIHAILFIRTSNCPYFLILPKSEIVARNNKKVLRNACLLLFHSALCDKISIQRPRPWRACWSLFQ